MAEKFYCYVDETGQDTQGDLFIVSVIVADEARDRAIDLCENIERETGKGRVKWIKAGYAQRLNYIQRILQESVFKGNLNFAIYRNSKDYLPLTILTIARAIVARGQKMYKATILIDGLPRSHERWVGSELRHLHIHVRKVRGTKKHQNDALIRLADAICGFVRDASEGQETMKELFERGKLSDFPREF